VSVVAETGVQHSGPEASDWQFSGPSDYGARMGKHASDGALREMDAAYAAFIQELRDKYYSENAIDTYDKTVSRFLRWAEGSFVPQGPRK
jgi:hypothetical protein